MEKKLKKELTIMVPALNEEGNLKNTVKAIQQSLSKLVKNYEIIIFNDGSKDMTGKVADNLAKKDMRIRVKHNKVPKGMGYCYKEGLKIAKYNYYMYIPGDNQFPKKALLKLIKHLGKTDIIIPYVTNMYIRHWSRRILSYLFTFMVNLLFGLNVRYFNGTVIHKTSLVKKALPKSDGHAYQAEILVKLIKNGATYIEVGYDMVERKTGLTSAFKLKNIKSVILAIITLFLDIQVFNKSFKLRYKPISLFNE